MTEREKWLQWRKEGIGSSDAPVIMGVSPWKTKFKLWEEKISPVLLEDYSNSYIKERGNQIEPRVRALFEVMKGESFKPALVQMSDAPFMRASLDGRSTCKRKIIEIKLLGLDDWTDAKNGMIPVKYQPQITHQMLVSGADVCFFLGYLYDKSERDIVTARLAIVECSKLNPQVVEAHIKACHDFWDLVLKKKAPELAPKDCKMLKGMAKQASKWKRLRQKALALESEIEKLRDELIAAAIDSGHPRCIVSGIKITKQERAGSVDYSKIPQLKDVDLAQYRKPGTSFWKMEA